MKIGMGRILAGLIVVVLAACSVAPAPVPTATGVGLSAEYFFGDEFKGPAFTQVQGKVSFNWGQIAPVLGMRPGNFSARFSGFIQPEFSEEYTFYVPTSGEAGLWIDGQLVASGSRVKLQAGKRYGLRLEFRKTARDAALGLEWSSPRTKRALVPQNRLYPAQESNKVQALAVPEGQNLLLNGDFEQDTGGWLTAAGEANPLTPGRSGGGKAVSVEDVGWLQQDLPFSSIESGKTYTLEIWGKSVSGQICSTGIGGATTDGTGFQQRLEFRGDWEKKTLNLTLPARSAWLAVFLTSSLTDCYYDDVSLQIGTTPPPPPTSGPNLITNGGFDSSTESWAVFGGSSVVGSGHRGSAVQAEMGTWIQQDPDFSKFAIGQTYVLRAWSRPTGTGDSSSTCTVGFSAGTPSRVLITRTLNFRNTQSTWEEKALSETIPPGTTWVAVYLAANSRACQFDDIGLASVNSPNLTGLNPASLALGATLSSSAQGNVQFSNNGVAPLTYSAKLEKGTVFSITSGASGSIKTAETAQIGISANCAATAETRTDTLVITSNDADEPSKQVALSLDCLKPMGLSPAFQRERAWGIVQNVGWSPDGNRLLTFGYQSPLTLWDATTGRRIAILNSTQFYSETSAAWNPVGDKIAIVSGNGLEIWDAYTGELIRQTNLFYRARSLDWSPDGRKIVAAQDSTVSLLDASTLQSSLSINATGSVQSVRWSPDGSMLATATTANDSIILWNANSGAEIRRINGRASDSIAWSPDSKQIASLRGIWKVADGSLVRELEPNTSSYGAIDWSNDGKFLVGMVFIFNQTPQTYSAEVRVWDLQNNTSTTIESITMAQYQQYADITFSPDSRKVFSSGLRGKPAIYDVTNSTLLLDFGINTNQIGFSPDGSLLGLTLNNRFQGWDSSTGELRVDTRQGSGAFAWSPDGSKLALNYYPDANLNGLRILNTANNSALLSSRIRADQISWSPSGDQLLIRSGDYFYNSSIQIVDASTGAVSANLAQGCCSSSFTTTWSQDGKSVLGATTNQIYTWNGSTGNLEKSTNFTTPSSSEVRLMNWSPKADAFAVGTRNYSSSQETSTRIISTSGQTLSTLPYASTIAWSPDGKKIALSPFSPSNNYSNTFTIYEVKSGFPIATVQAAGAIVRLEWSQTGNHIAALYTQGDTTALTVWKVSQ